MEHEKGLAMSDDLNESYEYSTNDNKTQIVGGMILVSEQQDDETMR